MTFHPVPADGDGIRCMVGVNHEAGFAASQCQSFGERGASRQRPSRHDECGVGIAHVEASALGIVAPGGFRQRVTVIYDAVFSQSTLGTPPASLPATGERGIKCCPVGAPSGPRR